MSNRISTRPCRLDDCSKTVHGHDLCIKHYKQMYRYGKFIDTIYEPRKAIIEGNIAKIPLGVKAKDGYTIVDKEFAWLDKYKWNLSSGYAKTVGGKRGLTKGMHRYILGDKPGMEIDHINNDRLDNRSANLRHCMHIENTFNATKNKRSKSGYKGVSFNKNANKYIAQLQGNGRHFYLGLFADPKEAAIAYDTKAREIHGAYAKLNFQEMF